MSSDANSDIKTISDDTTSEEQSLIGKDDSNELDIIKNLDLVSPELQPSFQIENFVKCKPHKVTEALMSDDKTIVFQALKVTWFFNGSLEGIDAVYFSEYLFPYIFDRTKTRVVHSFARCIKNPSFAQTIFNALTITYNIQTALPLLMICDQEFIYQMIVEKRLILPVRIFKKIYYKHPELGVRVLKEYIEHYEMYKFCDRHLYCIRNTKENIVQEYKCILHTLAKNRSVEFVDIIQNVIQTEKLCSKIGVLSKKCATKFLKKSKNAVIKHPHFFMPILPSQLISTKLLEMMFPGLMKYYCRYLFYTNKMLEYLKDFPRDKKFEILCKTYRDLYQHELLDKEENVTPALLRILPIEKRIKFAQEMIKNNSLINIKSYETTWTCYFPMHQALLIFKYLIEYAKTRQSKLDLILKMIYTCKINNDENELFNVLSYVADKEYITGDNLTIANEAMHKILEILEIS